MAGEWIEPKGRELMGSIFPGEWTCLSTGVYQGRCPGEEKHSKGGAATDCRLFTGFGPRGEKPGAFCLHTSCKGVLDALNTRFRDAIFAKPAAGAPGYRPPVNDGVARAPRSQEAWIPEFDIARLRKLVANVPELDERWYEERSPVDPRKITPGDFLERVFEDGERVLIFTEFRSQGDFLWEVGKGGYRLGAQQGVKAVRSKLPTDGGNDGMWYLSNPVDGQWHANPRRDGRFSRRSEEAVKAWRYLVVECDEEKTLIRKAYALKEARKVWDTLTAELAVIIDLGDFTGPLIEQRDQAVRAALAGLPQKWIDRVVGTPETWLADAARHEAEAKEVPGLWRRFLAVMPLDVVAIYTSGGASLHALVRVDQQDKPSFDTFLRMSAKKILPIFGADPGAMTPVRLTRLPGCTRKGRLQRLIWLNPRPEEGVLISSMMKVRGIEGGAKA